MSLHLLSKTPLRVISNSYAADGALAAVLPHSATTLLAASATNVNHFDIRPTILTETSDLEIILSGATLTDTADCDITATRPLGGTGVATVAHLRAFHFLLVSDPVTTEELDAGVSADRDASLAWTISNAAGSSIFAQGRLEVATAGDRSFSSADLPISYGSDVKIVFEFALFSLGTHLEVLTAAQ